MNGVTLSYFDNILFTTLNEFGARVNQRNYFALRNNLVQERKFGSSGFMEMVSLMARLTLPIGYDTTINERLKDDLLRNKRDLIKLFREVQEIIPVISKNFSLGIISNNSSGSANLLILTLPGKVF